MCMKAAAAPACCRRRCQRPATPLPDDGERLAASLWVCVRFNESRRRAAAAGSGARQTPLHEAFYMLAAVAGGAAGLRGRGGLCARWIKVTGLREIMRSRHAGGMLDRESRRYEACTASASGTVLDT